MAARLDAPRAGVRPLTATAPARWAGLAWPRLPTAAELATIGAGYGAYSLVHLAIRASRRPAVAHAAQLWRTERRLHLTVEPWLNHLAAAHPVLAVAAGYYYGLLHFLVTPLVLAWLYLHRPAAFPRLRSALVLATAAANVVFWVWPVAPPRFSLPGMTDILVAHDILGAASPRGPASLVNLYAAMPSLHVAWATWCALAIVTTIEGRWRLLGWLYPAATTFVVLASANHFLLDAVGGLAVAGLGVLATSRPTQRLTRSLACSASRDTGTPALTGSSADDLLRRQHKVAASKRRKAPAAHACRRPGRARRQAVMADPSLAARPRSTLPACAGIRPGADIGVRLPGGWLVAVWLRADGRRVVEVCDGTGTLAGLVVSTRLPIVSIDWGWSGTTRDANGARLWWALAIGHFPASDSQPTVTFTRRLPGARRTVQPGMPGGLWMAADGLWVAATTGRYTAAECLVGWSATALRLTPATPWRRP